MPASEPEGLFDEADASLTTGPPTEPDAFAPLAARMRPRTLEEFVGQEHAVGPGTLLRRAIEQDRLTSVIFWGPPGSGKSSLAHVIAHTTRAYCERYSAITSGVSDVRRVIERAMERRRRENRRTVLFVDEIHRWNRAQQDALLPHVENGTIILIGATTENPYFEVNAPLLSRSRLFRLEPLSHAQVRTLLERALTDTSRGLGSLNVTADPDALELLADIAQGDARRALNALEAAALAAPADAGGRRHITRALAEEGAQQRALSYDHPTDAHYDTVSALIKSIRGSDPDAALYWLARMLLAGEDIRFIARRLVILASEDVGNADPLALLVANSAAQAVMFVGMPEAQLILSQAVTYLATAPKSNACTVAISRAMDEIRTHGAKPVPVHLADTHSVRGRNASQAYLSPHDYPDHYVPRSYLPEGVQGLPFYEPTEQGTEAKIRQRMQERTRQNAPDRRPS
ncbi:MAG: replication-associated recombination protein A [Chloroherpetonaceae bacterium]|nr:replication-associated recombination protein A [Chthonomonadaceae bacterium]MDW8208701.1 replication-associated recombination protein A [Chloroherpetonaceae bacterium]